MGEYVKEMLQRDIEEKNAIKNQIKKLNILIIVVSIVGLFLIAAFAFNVFYTHMAIQETLTNREATIINRQLNKAILENTDSLLRR